jgi:DNA-directed RNA polymerase III subunit RPC8
MFVLARVKDNLKVTPDLFERPTKEVLTEVVHAKYANHVIMNVGLCICLYAFGEIGDAYIYPSDGSAHYKADFKLLVFRPFIGEVLTGTIMSCTEEGLKVSLGKMCNFLCYEPLVSFMLQ